MISQDPEGYENLKQIDEKENDDTYKFEDRKVMPISHDGSHFIFEIIYKKGSLYELDIISRNKK